MAHIGEGKDIVVGPRVDNECCTCCDKCWGQDADTGSTAQCTAMYPAGNLPHNCCNHTGNCPTSCCACPATGNLCLTISCPQCPTVDGMEFNLRQDMGLCICSGEVPTTDGNVPCYYESVINGGVHTIKTGIQEYNNVFEKWGWTGVICRGLPTAGINADGSDCAGDPGDPGKTRGEGLEISLCCCDTCGEKLNNTDVNPSDCHTCNYQLFLKWMSWTASDDYCICPDGPMPGAPPGTFSETQLVPICNLGFAPPPPASCDSVTHDVFFEDGQCKSGNPSTERPFILHYSYEDRWWNCDCCQNGGEAADNDVDMTFTIIEGTGPSGLCYPSPELQEDPPDLPC